MNKLSRLTALTAVLAGLSTPGAHAQYNIGQIQQLFTNITTPPTGFVGYHLIGPTTDQYNLPFGIEFDLGTTSSYTSNYELGIERSNYDFSLYSYTTNSGQFRLRGDNGQIELGTVIGHPASTNQLNIVAGRDTTPVITLDGLGISINGNQNSINLVQRASGTKRTSVNYAAAFQEGTDSLGTGVTTDWYLKDLATANYPLKVSPSSDLVTLGYGATINGTLTASGAFAHTGTTLGFYGGTPQTKPVITGCRCDGTALANLLQKLQQMGLITDQTTP